MKQKKSSYAAKAAVLAASFILPIAGFSATEDFSMVSVNPAPPSHNDSYATGVILPAMPVLPSMPVINEIPNMIVNPPAPSEKVAIAGVAPSNLAPMVTTNATTASNSINEKLESRRAVQKARLEAVQARFLKLKNRLK